MDVTYEYMKPRKEFGRQPMFSEQGPEMCDSIAPNVVEQKLYILRNPIHQATQNTREFSEHHINTIRAEYTSSGANHAEGGWPKDVNVIDPEATQRYRRKIEKDDGYIHCVMSIASGMEHYVYQNNAIDMYRTYFTELPSLPGVEHNSCRTVNVYRELRATRPISSICWQPDGGHRFAVTYVDVDYYCMPKSHTEAYIWDVDNANFPTVTIKPPSTLLDLQYSPRDPNLLIGALMSGQVGAWDSRGNESLHGLCPMHVAHRDYARNVLFINSKSNAEFFSGGQDGMVKWWDLRNLSEPIDEMILDVVKSNFDVQSMANACAVSVLEYEPTMPTRFMAGTDNGWVLGGNRKGKTAMEKIPLKFEAQLGPVWSVERNPFFTKNFLTVGDWTVKVWSEECRDSAVLWSPIGQQKITAATWSPTRLSLMMVVQWNGVVAIWDWLRRQAVPVLTMQVCEEPLMRAKIHEGGSLAALGSRKGRIFMIEMSSHLTSADARDKALMTAILERENKRERILEARLREIKLKMRQAEESSPVPSNTELDPSIGDKDLAEATTDYFAAVKKELLAM